MAKYKNKAYITQERYEFFLKTGVNYEGFVIGVGYAYFLPFTEQSLFTSKVYKDRERYCQLYKCPQINSSPEAIFRSYNYSAAEIQDTINNLSIQELSCLLLGLSSYDKYSLSTQTGTFIVHLEESDNISIHLSFSDKQQSRPVGELKLQYLLPYLKRRALSDGKINTNSQPIIFVQRIAEGPNSTISFFMAYGKDNEIVSGYFLEPGGPATTEEGKDKRIPEGVHQIEHYTSNNYPNNYRIYSNIVPKKRRILIHTGNYHYNTEGCFIPGESYLLRNGDYEIKGGTSKNKLDQLKAILNKGDATIIIKE